MYKITGLIVVTPFNRSSSWDPWQTAEEESLLCDSKKEGPEQGPPNMISTCEGVVKMRHPDFFIFPDRTIINSADMTSNAGNIDNPDIWGNGTCICQAGRCDCYILEGIYKEGAAADCSESPAVVSNVS